MAQFAETMAVRTKPSPPPIMARAVDVLPRPSHNGGQKRTVKKSKIETMSYEQFLKNYDGCYAEWLGGEVIIYMSASTRHQKMVVWFTTVLNLVVEQNDLGLILTAPTNMYLSKVERGREPDVLFVSQARLGIIQETHLAEPADMVIEVVSPESVDRDRGTKFSEYEQAGIQEYWLIDPIRQQAEFYRLGQDGYYRPVPTPEGIFRSAVVAGYWLRVADLWREPLPKIMDVMQELEK